MALVVLTAACAGQGATPPRAALPVAADTAGFAFANLDGALVVARPAQPLTYSDGLPAKRAASAHCAGQGAQLNPAAYGAFAGGLWRFAGGCI